LFEQELVFILQEGTLGKGQLACTGELLQMSLQALLAFLVMGIDVLFDQSI
jgi:hypothetical protein